MQPTRPPLLLIVAANARSSVANRGDLIAEVRRLGLRVVALVPEVDDLDAVEELGIEIGPIRLARASLNPWRDLRSVLEIARYVRRERPEVVFGYSAKPVIYGATLACGSERSEQCLDAEQPVEPSQDRGPVHDAVVPQRRGIEVEQRQGLPDQRLSRCQLSAGEAVADRNQEEVPAGPVHQARAEALVQVLEELHGVEHEGVQVGILAAEVMAAPKPEVGLDETVVLDDVLEPLEAAHAGRRPLKAHCSISRPAPTGAHSRCRG